MIIRGLCVSKRTYFVLFRWLIMPPHCLTPTRRAGRNNGWFRRSAPFLRTSGYSRSKRKPGTHGFGLEKQPSACPNGGREHERLHEAFEGGRERDGCAATRFSHDGATFLFS